MEELKFFKVRHFPNNGDPYITYSALPVYCTKPTNSLEVSKEEYLLHVGTILVG